MKLKKDTQFKDQIYEWLIHQDSFGIIVVDQNFFIKIINSWVTKHIQKSSSELLNNNLLEVFPEIKSRNLDRFLYAAREGNYVILSNKLHKYFIKILLENQELEFQQQSVEITPLYNDDIIENLLIKIVDVTERVINEERLKTTISSLQNAESNIRRNFERFKSLAENLPDYVLRLNKNLEIEFANNKLLGLLNLRHSDLLNKNIRDIPIKHNLINLFIENLQKVLTTLKQNEIKYSFKRGDKEFHYYSIAVPEFNALVNLESIIIITRDITQEEEAKRKYEEYLQELEKLNQNKDKLFSIIAHDLRSPFNYLLNVVDLLEESFEELDKETVQRYLHEFKLTTKNVYSLLENLLTWAHFQRETIKVKPKEFKLKEFIDLILELYQNIAEKKNIQIFCDISNDLLIEADPDLFTIMIRNLVTNAVKFTKPGGKIFISAALKENELELKISDTGIGIPEEKLQSLFDIKNVKSEKGTAGEKGSGLGLMLIKEIVDFHKGNIRFESELGRGTSVIINLPFPLNLKNQN